MTDTVRYRGSLWLVSVIIPLVLFGAVLINVEWKLFLRLFASLDYRWFVLALSCFAVEGISTALRIRVFTPGQHRFSVCLRLNAWYILALMALPARLGEVAGIVLFKRYLNQHSGPATLNVLAQRLMDVAILGCLFVSLALAFSPSDDQGLVLLAVGAAITLAIVSLSGLPLVLGWLSKLLLRLGGRHRLKAILRPCLGARTWYQRQVGPAQLIGGTCATIGRWAASLCGIVCILLALELNLDSGEMYFIAVSYTLLAILPLHTVGGIGVTDAGILALLTTLGTPLAEAAAASLFMRGVVILFAPLFFLAVMAATALTKPDSSASESPNLGA